MKSIPALFAVLTASTLFGCSTSSHRDFSRSSATEITVSVRCSEPNMKFSGSIVSDGQTAHLTGTGSGTFNARGHEFVCSFQKEDTGGQISISVSEGGKVLGNTSNSERLGGMRSEVLRSRSVNHTLFSTF